MPIFVHGLVLLMEIIFSRDYNERRANIGISEKFYFSVFENCKLITCILLLM